MKKNLLLVSSLLLISSSLLPLTVLADSYADSAADYVRFLDAEKPDALEKVPEYYKSLSIDEINNGITEKVYVFPDGSTFEISIEDKNDFNPRQSRKVTTTSYGARYNNHEFTFKRGTQRAAMRIDGYLAREGYGMSQIDNAFGGSTSGFGTTGANTLKIIRTKEDTLKSLSALAELTWTVSGTIGASWGGLSGSIPKGSTCHMYVAFIRGQVKVSDKIP